MTYQDIIGKNNSYNYIAVKSICEKEPDIKILNEEELEKSNLLMNNFEKKILQNENNNNMSLKKDIINNFLIPELNPIINCKNKENINLININNQSFNTLQNKNTIELFSFSRGKNPFLVNNLNSINHDSCPSNPFININSGEFHYNLNKEREYDFSFNNYIPSNEN